MSKNKAKFLQQENAALKARLAAYEKKSQHSSNVEIFGISWSDVGAAALSVAKTLGPIAIAALGTAAEDDEVTPVIGPLGVYKEAGTNKIIVDNTAFKKGYGATLLLSRSPPDAASTSDEGGDPDDPSKVQTVAYVNLKPASEGGKKRADISKIIGTFMDGDFIARPYLNASQQKEAGLGAGGPVASISWSTVGKTIALAFTTRFLVTKGLYFERTPTGFSITTNNDSTLVEGALRIFAQGISNVIKGVLSSDDDEEENNSEFTPVMTFTLPSALKDQKNVALDLDIDVPLDDATPKHCMAKDLGVKFF